MTQTTESQTNTAKRPVLLWIAGGCGVILLACLGFLVFNAVYWSYRVNVGGGGAVQSPEQLKAHLETLPEGDAARGEQVFNGAAHCSACHSLQAGAPGAGPSLAGVGERAASARPGYPAELYLLESIISPAAYIAPGGQGAVMPGGYEQQLSEQELADLLAFLSAQE